MPFRKNGSSCEKPSNPEIAQLGVRAGACVLPSAFPRSLEQYHRLFLRSHNSVCNPTAYLAGRPTVKPRATFEKRRKEQERQERQREKEERRQQRKAEAAKGPAAANGEDPDIAHIVA